MLCPMTAAQNDPYTGRLVDGRYQVEQYLGEGAVGAVYRAMDNTHGRIAALKIWHAATLDQQTRARFIREAKALDTLHHPNIVTVYGAGLVDGLPYVAMEFLEGSTLDDLIGEGQAVEVSQAMEISRQMLDALAYAHDRNVVHRDLKPENVFLANDAQGKPRVKILDYGLAKFLAPEEDPLQGKAITMMGMVMGTPLYMPPEQAAGAKVDLRVDVYAAACVMFEVFSGRLPYLAESHAGLIKAHMMDPIPDLSEALEGQSVAPELQALLARGMAKKPDDRFPTARDMLGALASVPRTPIGRATPSAQSDFRPDAETEVIPRSAPMNPALLALCGAGGASLLIVLLWALLR